MQTQSFGHSLIALSLTAAIATLIAAPASALDVPNPPQMETDLHGIHYNGTCHAHDDQKICDDYTIPNASGSGARRKKATKRFKSRKFVPARRIKRLKRR